MAWQVLRDICVLRARDCCGGGVRRLAPGGRRGRLPHVRFRSRRHCSCARNRLRRACSCCGICWVRNPNTNRGCAILGGRYGPLLLWPWQYTYDRVPQPDLRDFELLGAAMVNAMDIEGQRCVLLMCRHAGPWCPGCCGGRGSHVLPMITMARHISPGTIPAACHQVCEPAPL